MAYATVEDCIEKYGRDVVLSSVARGTDDISDQDALTKALIAASSEIDSYIGGRYTVPFPLPAPDIVKQRCVDMGIYLACPDATSLTEEKRQRYVDAIDWLKQVGKGLAVIVTIQQDGTGDDQGDTDLPIMQSDRRLFTRKSMRGLM